MRIAVIGPTYPFKGGISHFTTVLVNRLRKRNRVHFISWKRQYPSFLYPVEQKDTVSGSRIAADAEYILDFFNPTSWVYAFFSIRKENPELLVLMWVTPIQAPIYFLIAFLIKRFTNIDVLFLCHNVLPHEHAVYDVPFAKLAFSQGDVFMVHSNDDKKDLETLVSGRKILKGFVPLFNIFPRNKKYDISSVKKQLHLRNKVLIFFGYIRPYKGVRYLIKAMPVIVKNNPDTSLLIVGEFWLKDKEDYRQLVRDLGMEKHVVFIDRYVSNEELEKYFSVSDVAVLPYVTATQSASIQTAYAFGKPVISTAVGGLSEVVADGVTGYIVKREDENDIAQKVDRFFRQPIRSDKVIKETAKFSWENYIRLLPVES